MKNWIDPLVILVAAAVIFCISYFWDDKILSRFSVIIFVAGYLGGKMAGRHQQRKLVEKEVE